MLNPALKRFILPFAPQKNGEPFNSEVEEAAVYAMVELERMKGGGLILKQPDEKIVFLSKLGYPLWLFPKNERTYIFDDLKNSKVTISYFELPSAKVFMESLENNSKTLEDFIPFLSDHSNYFSQTKNEKELTVGNLIVDFDFKRDFNEYRREAVEVMGQTASYALLPPTLQEASVSSVVTEIADLQMKTREDADKLSECLRAVSRITSQFVTDLDYAAEAIRD